MAITSPPKAIVSARSNRCAYTDCDGQCKKKTGLTATKCRCGLVFCSKHRLPEVHNCAHNFRSTHLENMDTLVGNMKCVAQKI